MSVKKIIKLSKEICNELTDDEALCVISNVIRTLWKRKHEP
jgi:hypothetical protein